VSRLKEIYRREVMPAMMKEQGYKNPMQVPRLDKIVLNVSLGEAILNQRALEGRIFQVASWYGHRGDGYPPR